MGTLYVKDIKNIEMSRRASRRQLRAACKRVMIFCERDERAELGIDKIDMANTRADVAEISQRFHEFNAYRNVLETE